MIDTKDYRNHVIKVLNANGDVAASYEGKIYIYYDHKMSDGCFHFVTDDGRHHRIYGEGTILVDEV